MRFVDKISRPLKPSKYKCDQIKRKIIFERDKFTCQTCGIKPKNFPVDYNGRYTVNVKLPNFEQENYLILDHIIPWKKGGTIELSNLQTLCDPCNSSKGDRPA
mgnify:CR=1 FL=1